MERVSVETALSARFRTCPVWRYKHLVPPRRHSVDRVDESSASVRLGLLPRLFSQEGEIFGRNRSIHLSHPRASGYDELYFYWRNYVQMAFGLKTTTSNK
jgi:hypothetical protein